MIAAGLKISIFYDPHPDCGVNRGVLRFVPGENRCRLSLRLPWRETNPSFHGLLGED
jgi:hypothetical protein